MKYLKLHEHYVNDIKKVKQESDEKILAIKKKFYDDCQEIMFDFIDEYGVCSEPFHIRYVEIN